MRARRQDGSGFTLIEMLVVMAVILTLLGIMMPSLQGVRDRAYGTVCANNLHQLGIAFNNYLNDNNGYFPGTGPCDAYGATRDNWIRWGACGTAGNYDKSSAIFAYLTSKDVLLCPIDGGEATYRPGLSYPMNAEFQANDSVASSINRRAIANGNLANYILLCEQDLGPNCGQGGNDDSHMHTYPCSGGATGDFEDGGGKMGTRHNGKAACLYVDGHVEFHKKDSAASSLCTCCTGAQCSGGAPSCPGFSCSPGCCTATPASKGDIDPFGYCVVTGTNPLCPFTPQGSWVHK